MNILICLLLSASLNAQHSNVMMIVVDALRYDAIELADTPNIDALASRSIVYNKCYSHSCWTMPSVASMMTGVYPNEHGVVFPPKQGAVALDSSFVTIAEVFQQCGYVTKGVSANPLVGPKFGFNQGFDTFKNVGSWTRNVGPTLKVAKKALKSTAPWFIYVHFLDPHGPYADVGKWKPTAEDSVKFNKPVLDGKVEFLNGLNDKTIDWPGTRMTKDEVDYLRNLYHMELEQVDIAIGKLLAGIDNNTLIVLTSDHGEEFYERETLGHGRHVNNETIHVPLMISGPDIIPAVCDSVVEHIDLTVSILNYAGLNAPPTMRGQLLPVMFNTDRTHSAFGFTRAGKTNLAYYITGNKKIISDHMTGECIWYNLLLDEGETNGNTTPNGNHDIQMLMDLMGKYERRDPVVNIDDNLKQQLKSLGY